VIYIPFSGKRYERHQHLWTLSNLGSFFNGFSMRIEASLMHFLCSSLVYSRLILYHLTKVIAEEKLNKGTEPFKTAGKTGEILTDS
jgi:hypothetical protein